MDQVWEKLCRGETGIRPVTIFDTSRCRTNSAGETLNRFPSDSLDRMVSIAAAGILKALHHAGVDLEYVQTARSALIIGTSLGHLFENESGPVNFDHFMSRVKEELKLSIPSLLISSACSSGTDALAKGTDFIEFLQYDLIIGGGVDVLDIYKMLGHSSLHTLSPTICKPFDAMSDGTSLGEGAGFMILESERSNALRKGRMLAEVSGRSNTTDTSSVTAPDPNGTGAIRVIKQALQQSGFERSQVAYVNAHGSGTPTNDAMESVTYSSLFQHSSPAISSTKAAFGHTLGATGAIEAIVAVLALMNQEAPPTANSTNIHESWESLNVVLGSKPVQLVEPQLALSVTYGFGGANGCMVFSRPTIENECR